VISKFSIGFYYFCFLALFGAKGWSIKSKSCINFYNFESPATMSSKSDVEGDKMNYDLLSESVVSWVDSSCSVIEKQVFVTF